MNPFSGIAVNWLSANSYYYFHCWTNFRLSIVVHDIPESMEQCISLFDIRDNDIWFFDVVFDHVRQLYSNRNYSQVPDQVVLPDNAENVQIQATMLCLATTRKIMIKNN